MSLAGVAKQTLEITARGAYLAPSGATVNIREAVDHAVRGTALYRPEQLDEVVAGLGPAPRGRPHIEVTAETTAEAARRLVEADRSSRVVALNFASARNPGGGFLRGAKAQEEDLARCSALYECQLQAREYYDANRATTSLLYTDHIIYSPRVPFFRDERLDLLEAPFEVSIITAPAPNAGEVLRRERNARAGIREALERRAEYVLAVARERGDRVLVLGAWGCGVFRNDPDEVAETFATHLASPTFAGAFERVVFAIYSRSRDQKTLTAFGKRFRVRTTVQTAL